MILERILLAKVYNGDCEFCQSSEQLYILQIVREGWAVSMCGYFRSLFGRFTSCHFSRSTLLIAREVFVSCAVGQTLSCNLCTVISKSLSRSERFSDCFSLFAVELEDKISREVPLTLPLKTGKY